MRRIAMCVLVLLTLCGCGVQREASYVVVEPHNEDYGVALDSDILTVSSYLSLKNALLNVVQDGMEEAVIRTDAYPGNLGEDLSQAVYEVTQMSPLGAYAVSGMTYDYSRIVSYYEIHMNVTYKRTREELQEIAYVTDSAAVRGMIQEAMAQYVPRLVLRVGSYTSFDLAAAVEDVYLEHPEFALELPETTMELYPDSGTQRILEIRFSYAHSQEELEEHRQEMLEQVARLSELYGSSNTALTNARRLYERLGRSAVLEPVQDGGISRAAGAYSALIENHAGSYGFAQAYRLLLEECGIPCTLITGQRGGTVHYWCMAVIDGMSVYVDPSRSVGGQRPGNFLMGDEELAAEGYFRFNAEEYPPVELPWYLKSPAFDAP